MQVLVPSLYVAFLPQVLISSQQYQTTDSKYVLCRLRKGPDENLEKRKVASETNGLLGLRCLLILLCRSYSASADIKVQLSCPTEHR